MFEKLVWKLKKKNDTHKKLYYSNSNYLDTEIPPV